MIKSEDWHKLMGRVSSNKIVVVDERLLSQVPDIVRSIPPMQVFSMRQKTQILWDSYFNSVDIILQRTLEV